MARNRQPSKQMRLLLAVLSTQRSEWRHGYDLLKDTGLSSGTLYPLLMRMSDTTISRTRLATAAAALALVAGGIGFGIARLEHTASAPHNGEPRRTSHRTPRVAAGRGCA